FVGRITFDALRASIPARNNPVWVKHEDCVVRHTGDEQSKLTLAFAQRIEGGATLGDIARNLGEALQLALLVSDGVNDNGSPETAAVLAYAPSFRFATTCSCGGIQNARRQ